jgi:hypothetical protein
VSVLDRLARRMGIEPEFRDATGATRRTSAQVTRGLLRAMGLTVLDAHDAESALRDLERTQARRPLPPVMVVRQPGSRLGIPLTLPDGTGSIRWSIRDERGVQREGEASFSADAEVSSPQFGRVDGHCLVIEVPATGYHRLRIEGNTFQPG